MGEAPVRGCSSWRTLTYRISWAQFFSSYSVMVPDASIFTFFRVSLQSGTSPNWNFYQLALFSTGTSPNWHGTPYWAKLNLYFNLSEIEPNLSLIHIPRHEFSQKEKYKISVAILARNSLSTDFQVVLFWLIH